MKIFLNIILILISLMSGAAGLVKVMKMPQEVSFFETAGLSLLFIIPLGAVQILSALMALYPKTRRYGLGLMALCFLVSAIMIFISGNMGFGAVSLLPVAVAAALSAMRWGKGKA